MTRVLASRFRRGRSRVLLLWAMSICIATSAGIWTLLAGELPTGPRAPDRQVVKQVTEILRKEHLSKHALDDEISRRSLKTFLKALDPWKMYFYQSDVDEFMLRQNDIDDMVKERDTSFSYTIFNRFLARVDERQKMIPELIAMDHDFTVHEEINKDADSAQYPKDEAAARERWRRRIKYDLLVLKGDKKNGKADIQELRDRLTRRYRGIAKRWHQTDADELLELFLTSVTSSFDPHTTYMSPSSLENFEIQMRLNLDGIGAALQVVDGYTEVSKIIPGGAADKLEGTSKLKPNDRIVSVGQGETGEMIDVVEMKLNDVVDKIRGKAGTIVRLGVISPGNPEVKILSIVRAKIELKDSEAQSEIIQDVKDPKTGEIVKNDKGSPLKVGVIDLPSFYMDMEGARRGKQDFKSTTRDVAKILEKFKAEGVDTLILDLRHNGGGSLTEAINLTGLFIDQGPVVQVKDPNGSVQHYDDMDAGEMWKGPMVVLISKFSASASEILAGAIQDYGRGLIVGDHATHGKGTVQSLMNLGGALFKNAKPPNLGALKITMQQFYRPNGDSTQKRGVMSDVELPSITNEMKVGESDLEYALEFDKVQAAHFVKYPMVTPAMVARLSQESEKRRAESEDFIKQAKKIERYKEYQTRKTATLNEKEYFDQIKKVNPDEEEEKQIDKASGNESKDAVVKRDYYFNEVLNITADYFKELKPNRVVKAK